MAFNARPSRPVPRPGEHAEFDRHCSLAMENVNLTHVDVVEMRRSACFLVRASFMLTVDEEHCGPLGKPSLHSRGMFHIWNNNSIYRRMTSWQRESDSLEIEPMSDSCA
jgi:hypothetical protein